MWNSDVSKFTNNQLTFPLNREAGMSSCDRFAGSICSVSTFRTTDSIHLGTWFSDMFSKCCPYSCKSTLWSPANGSSRFFQPHLKMITNRSYSWLPDTFGFDRFRMTQYQDLPISSSFQKDWMPWLKFVKWFFVQLEAKMTSQATSRDCLPKCNGMLPPFFIN